VNGKVAADQWPNNKCKDGALPLSHGHKAPMTVFGDFRPD